MLHEAQLSRSYWGEAVTCAEYIQNRLPTKAIPSHTTPFELWHKKKPDLTHIRVFGSRCYAKIPDPLLVKLDGKTEACIFLDYSPVSKGYKVKLLRTGATVVSKDVIYQKEPAPPSQAVQAMPLTRCQTPEDPHFFLPSGSQTPATPSARVSTREPQHPLSDAPQVLSDQHQRPPSLPVTNPLDDHLSSAAPESDAADAPSPGLSNIHILLPMAPDSARNQKQAPRPDHVADSPRALLTLAAVPMEPTIKDPVREGMGLHDTHHPGRVCNCDLQFSTPSNAVAAGRNIKMSTPPLGYDRCEHSQPEEKRKRVSQTEEGRQATAIAWRRVPPKFSIDKHVCRAQSVCTVLSRQPARRSKHCESFVKLDDRPRPAPK
uniref:Retroviral polymerase SH3-like domain-containing protein n=1 Tax=Physcomitrium patens TaxID=3218 RepID=A0A2K1IEI4_PHYPA|nr:hypothetical protein PHYPA_029836 [Physcomitrium patens]